MHQWGILVIADRYKSVGILVAGGRDTSVGSSCYCRSSYISGAFLLLRTVIHLRGILVIADRDTSVGILVVGDCDTSVGILIIG